jgi:nitroreductase
MDEKIAQLLKLAVAAPSGDNCQPWRLTRVDGRLQLFNRPDQDTSLYNHAQRASLLAHGALLENLAVAAPGLGLRAEIRLFPDPAAPEHVAEVIFAEGEMVNDPLSYWIERRCTNRKKYVPIPLTEFQRRELAAVPGEGGAAQVHLLHESGEVRTVAALLAKNDRLVFENRNLHAFLFDHLRWNDEEAGRTGDGMDIKTLELAPPDRLAFPLLKHWSLVGFLNRLGLPRLIEHTALKLLGSSAAIAGVSLPDLEPATLVRGGRAMQRFWLQATALGLAVQPVAGLALLVQRLRSGNNAELDEAQRALVTEVGAGLDGAFGSAGRHLVMCFRLGTSAPPSARALRRPVPLAG